VSLIAIGERMDGVAAAVVGGTAAVLAGVLAQFGLLLNGRLERRARQRAEEKAAEAERQKADLEHWMAIAQEYRADIERLRDEIGEVRTELTQARQSETDARTVALTSGRTRMTPVVDRWESWKHTRVGRVLTSQLFLAVTSVLAIVAVLVAGLALYVSVQSTGRAAAAAKVSAERANQKAAAAEALAVKLLRTGICDLVHSQTRLSAPPTTARGAQSATAWERFGQSPLLHCGP
jgi:hypothetical protein